MPLRRQQILENQVPAYSQSADDAGQLLLVVVACRTAVRLRTVIPCWQHGLAGAVMCSSVTAPRRPIAVVMSLGNSSDSFASSSRAS